MAPRFDRMVATEAHQARMAEQARRRQSNERDERSMPDTSPRNVPTRPEPNRTDRSTRSDENASSKEDRAPDDVAATANQEEHTTCSPKSETGGKPDETGDVGTDTKSTDERVVCIGPAEKNSSEVIAIPEAAAPEVAGQEISDAVLLAEALLAAQSSADPSVAVGGDAANVAGSGAAGSVTPVAIGTAAVAQASTAGVATGVAPLPGGASVIATPAVQAQNNAKADVAAELVAAQSDSGEATGVEAALLAAPKTAKQGAKIAPATDDGASEGDETVSAVETGKGEKAETLVNKSTVQNLHPTRASHFADFLDAFGGSSAIHRPADILAGLDRGLTASTLNRGAEVTRPTPLQMLPIEIGMQAVRGVTSFQIRLDPAELGRIDVKLQIRDNGEVNASLVVDRVETLQMLKRDASSLEFAFEQAGLKQSPDGLTFSLRGEGQSGQGANQRQSGAPDETIDDALAAQIGEVAMRRVLIPNSSIDRMV